jgi:hypothetical protein
MSDYRTRTCECGCDKSFTPPRHQPGKPAYLNDTHRLRAQNERKRLERLALKAYEERVSAEVASGTDPYLVSPQLDPWRGHREKKLSRGGELGYNLATLREMETDAHGQWPGSDKKKALRESYEELRQAARLEVDGIEPEPHRKYTRWRYSDSPMARGLHTSPRSGMLSPDWECADAEIPEAPVFALRPFTGLTADYLLRFSLRREHPSNRLAVAA